MRILCFCSLILLAVFTSSPASSQSDPIWDLKTTFTGSKVIGIAKHTASAYVALASDGTAKRSTDNGKTWRAVTTDLTNATALARDGLVESILFAGTTNGVWTSSDAKTWKDAGLAGKHITALHMMAGANVLIAGTANGVFLSADRGKNWEEFRAGLASTNIQAVGGARTSYGYAGTPAGLFIAEDGKDEWQSMTLGNVDVREIRVSGQTGVVWVGTNNAAYSSATFGSQWSKRLTTTAPVTSIWRISPHVLVATTNGIHYSAKDGQNFKAASEGLESTNVTTMYSTDDQFMLVATSDGGLYRSFQPLASLMSVAKREGSFFSVYPNPAMNVITVRADEDHLIENVRIFDAAGRVVHSEPASANQITLTIQLPEGAYTIEVTTMGKTSIQQLMIEDR